MFMFFDVYIQEDIIMYNMYMHVYVRDGVIEIHGLCYILRGQKH